MEKEVSTGITKFSVQGFFSISPLPPFYIEHILVMREYRTTLGHLQTLHIHSYKTVKYRVGYIFHTLKTNTIHNLVIEAPSHQP